MDPDSIKRQTGINEWYYHYRLETLFIMQLLFIGFSSIVLLSVLASYLIVPKMFVIYYSVLVIGIIAAIWYFKWTYTSNTRDYYHWDKKRFPQDTSTYSAYNSAMKAAIASQIAAHCPS